MSAADSKSNSHAEDVLRRARELLDTADVVVASDLLALCQDEVKQTNDVLMRVESGRAYTKELVAQRQSCLQDIEKQTLLLKQAESARESEQAVVKDAGLRRAECQRQAEAGASNVTELKKKVDALTATHARLLSLDAAKKELDALESSVTEFEKATEFAGKKLQDALQDRARTLESLERANSELLIVSAHRDHEKAIQNIVDRTRTLSEQLRRVQEQLSEGAAQKGQLTIRLSETESRLEAQQKRYSEAVAMASDCAQLAELVNSAAEIVERLGLNECPLCGVEYDDADELIRHVRQATRVQHTHEQERLEEIRAQIVERETELASMRKSQEEAASLEDSARREEVKLTAELQNLERERERLKLKSLPPAGEESAETAKRKIENLRSQLAEEERACTEASNASSAAHRKLAELNDRVLMKKAQVAGLEQGRDDPRQETSRLESELLSVKSQLAAATERSGHLDKDYQTAVAKEREAQRSVEALIDSVGTVRAQLASSEQRLKGLEKQIGDSRNQIAELTGRREEPDISRRLEELDSRRTALGAVISELEVIVRLEEDRRVERQIKTLKSEDVKIARELKKLSQAQSRISELDVVASKTEEAEARESLDQLHGAIQECLTTLYPHRHLNRLGSLLSDGEVLICDNRVP